jgi:hypothetical protein
MVKVMLLFFTLILLSLGCFASELNLTKIQETNSLALDIQKYYPDAISPIMLKDYSPINKSVEVFILKPITKTVLINASKVFGINNTKNVTVMDYVKTDVTKTVFVATNVSSYNIDYFKLIIDLFYKIESFENRITALENHIKSEAECRDRSDDWKGYKECMKAVKTLVQPITYSCLGIIKECPFGLSSGLGTRCYQDVNKTTWFNCATGWIKQ